MKREDVRQKMELFIELMRREQELTDQLLTLKFKGSKADVREAMDRQTSILAEIRHLREVEMVPLLAEVAQFAHTRELQILNRKKKKKKITKSKTAAAAA